ncbi:MAG: ATPase, T2SS/T4P/T4SS family, partial [Patescibacteria group bacterium]|nr:ATPase, T2SS/T4P/T4SS family [Patescibacteria group bacterium]
MAKKQYESKGEDGAKTVETAEKDEEQRSVGTDAPETEAAATDDTFDIKALLLKENYIAEQDVARVEQILKDHDTTFEQAVLSSGILTRELLGQAIAEHFHVPYADIETKQPPREQVLKIPEEVAVAFHAVLFGEGAEEVAVTTDRPTAPGLHEALAPLFVGKKVALHYSLPEDIDVIFRHYRKSLETRFSQIVASEEHVAPEILEEIFADALTSRASDVHFEPQESEVVIRFRIDGVLHDAGHIPKEYYDNVLNRVKVESGLRIDEHFAAQDGSMRYRHELLKEKQVVDMRVSIVPVVDGEKIAVRLLSEYIRSLALSELGLSPRNQELLRTVLKKPVGMVLVTGPTGAGKT